MWLRQVGKRRNEESMHLPFPCPVLGNPWDGPYPTSAHASFSVIPCQSHTLSGNAQ
jgi:hypothetical protein